MALSAQRPAPEKEVWDRRKFVLKTSTACYKGGMAVIDTSTGGVVKPAAGGASQVFIGFFAESVGSGTGQTVDVELGRMVTAYWLENTDTGNTVAATDLGKVCYLLDDQTVTMSTAGSATKAGRVWGIGTRNGVACALVELFAPAIGDS